MNSDSLLDTDRVEAFTDGVIGVVATLLVLDLRVPHLPEHATFLEAWSALRPIGSKLITFALSFLFAVIVWVNHHQVFHSLKGADRTLLWLNNLLLFWLCLLPFPTAFLGEYSSLTIGPILLSLTLCASATAFLLLVRHADAAGLYRDDVQTSTRKTIMRRSLLGPPAFAATGVLVAVSPYASVAAMFCVMGYYFVPARIVHTKHE